MSPSLWVNPSMRPQWMDVPARYTPFYFPYKHSCIMLIHAHKDLAKDSIRNHSSAQKKTCGNNFSTTPESVLVIIHGSVLYFLMQSEWWRTQFITARKNVLTCRDCHTELWLWWNPNFVVSKVLKWCQKLTFPLCESLQSFPKWETDTKISCEQTLQKGDGPKTGWTRELTNDRELILVIICVQPQ